MLNRFMGELSDHFGNAGCNDYILENNPENRELVKDAIQNSDMSKEDQEDFLEELKKYEEMDIFGKPAQEKIYTTDFLVFEYLVKKAGFKIEEPEQ